MLYESLAIVTSFQKISEYDKAIWRNGDILEQLANNRGLFKRYSKLLYTTA